MRILTTKPDALAKQKNGDGQMSKYQIENTTSGVVFGIYEGETERDALDAMARDAGYKNHAEVEEQFNTYANGEIVVTEMETWVAWMDGHKDDAVEFDVPYESPRQFDVAQAGADALGVDVCEELNVERKHD